MSAYQAFVRDNVGKMSGATQPERMKQVAALWRQKKGSQGKGDAVPEQTPPPPPSKGKGKAAAPPADMIPEEPPAKGKGRKRGGCASCDQKASGRVRKAKGAQTGGRRRRAGQIVAEAAPMQWRGGSYGQGIGEPGFGSLDMGNSLPRPRYGLGAFAPLVGRVGGGIKMPPDQGQSGEGFMDNLFGMASMFG